MLDPTNTWRATGISTRQVLGHGTPVTFSASRRSDLRASMSQTNSKDKVNGFKLTCKSDPVMKFSGSRGRQVQIGMVRDDSTLIDVPYQMHREQIQA
jgi:hypothetical protein